MKPMPQATLLALALAFAAAATAQTPAAAPKPLARPGTQAELAAARAELARAAERVAALSGGEAMAMAQLEARRPVVGVVLAPDPQAGVRIAGVTPEGPAARAGLLGGDRLLSIDGREILGSSPELRVENARKLLGKVDTRTAVRLGYARNGRGAVASVTPKLDERFMLMRGAMPMLAPGAPMPPAMAHQIEREIVRLGPEGHCKGEGCALPMLAEAFRWNGLNLASVDPQLGRYFGTSSGVLVLSTGRALGDLQPGDVLRKVDGKPVASPREAMAAPAAGPAAAPWVRSRAWSSSCGRAGIPPSRCYLPHARAAPPSPRAAR